MAEKTTSGVVATPHHLATEAGQRSFEAGGNAFDAALTAAAVLAVVYPHNCSPGGDLLAVVRRQEGALTFVNASGRAPYGLDPDMVRAVASPAAQRVTGPITGPVTGPLTVTVPGVVSGWAAVARLGARLERPAHFAEAIDFARNGFPVSPGLARAVKEYAEELLRDPGLRAVFAPDGTLLGEGQRVFQPALAETLGELAHLGDDTFYRGALAGRLIDGMRRLGVPLQVGDLGEHEPTAEPPLSAEIAGARIHTGGPNSQGYVLLKLLRLLELARHDQAGRDAARHYQAGPGAVRHDQAGPDAVRHDAPRRDRQDGSRPLHRALPADVLSSAFHRTSEERDEVLADPDAMSVGVEELIDDGAVAQLLSEVRSGDLRRPAWRRPRPDGDTVAIVAIDSQGNAVSLIQSVYHSFGALLLEPGTGIILHNRGAGFSLDPRSPNVLAPGKRPAHTLTPLLVESPDALFAVGTMGGRAQPQLLAQVLSRLLAGESPVPAVAAPRWVVGGLETGQPSDTLHAERDVDGDVRHELARYPGRSVVLPPWSEDVGHAQVAALRRQESSGAEVLETGTDPRADGCGSR